MEKYFTIDFWRHFVTAFNRWLVTDLISIIILIILLVIILKINSALVNKMKGVLLKRMAYKDEEPDLEIEKRLNTLMGVLRKTLRIVSGRYLE